MKYVFNKLNKLDTSGAIALETAFIVVPFFVLFLVTFDLGRFFVTQHSVRTLASELIRQTLIHCTGQPTDSVCTLPSSGSSSIANAESMVPFLASTAFVSTPTASRSIVGPSTGSMTISATASYSFEFLPVWSIFAPSWSAPTQISQTTQLSY
jgi:hypothetical protein